MRFILILTVGLVACNQHSKTQKTEDSVATSITTIPVAQQKQPQDTRTSYDSAGYRQYIPQKTIDLLGQKLPDWHMAAPNNWDTLWFKEYKKDSSLVNYMAGDFNCDQKQDYALVLANRKDELAIWVLQSEEDDYKAINLRKLGQLESPIEIGIELVAKGNLNYIDVDEDAEGGVKSIALQCPGIQVVFFEKGAVTYYWEKGKYHEVQTGD